MYYGAIEAGGTKFVCAISNQQFEIIERISIPTTTPTETLHLVFKFFDQFPLKSMGIGTFGPIDVNKNSGTYGFITTTPKAGWGYFDFLGAVKGRYNIPIAWTTDVNAAAYGEYKKGSAIDNKSCLYLTIGTGIGGGAIINGEILEGHGHAEMGHILVRQHPDDSYKGVCPYHNNCLEGLASGPAIEGRYGKKGYELEKNHKVWEMEAYYLAQILVDLTLTIRPEKIILGGGVMKQCQLYPLIRNEFANLMNNYVPTPDLNHYIVSPGLGDNAGIIGSLLLGAETE
ncbi:ROK family protein [Pullulanibacillus sp. KACC 23026]|uniref:ROK family protein n=1 Tax=Pullulanibacillus sp. KACC 23026 TaxID=3028315 RepID=UPI0023AF6DDA|nr:ROK family protein [Pullulanibacillus sp. KACC 23026]WEG13378.1 ROK family protein [Pullulanibacillus sp. KACC 23026]